MLPRNSKKNDLLYITFTNDDIFIVRLVELLKKDDKIIKFKVKVLAPYRLKSEVFELVNREALFFTMTEIPQDSILAAIFA